MAFDYALRAREAHIWIADVTALYAQAIHLAAVLSAEERSIAEGMRFVRHRDERIVSRALLRLLLGAYCAAPPQTLDIRSGASGKPALGVTRTPALHFNVSHSAEFALYAFAQQEIGVDIEKIDASLDVQAVARHVFSREERAILEGATPERARDLFHVFWTAKEACVKTTGVGLSEALVDVDLSGFAQTGPGLPCGPMNAAGCSVWSIAAPGGYRAALATLEPDRPTTLRVLRVDASRLALGSQWSSVLCSVAALAALLTSAVASSDCFDLHAP